MVKGEKVGRPLRWLDQTSTGLPTLVEITSRCQQGRMLLRPNPTIKRVAIGCLARAQQKTPEIGVVGFNFQSNHYHLLLTAYEPKHLSKFMGSVQSNLAREICKFHDWGDKVWARRYRSICVSEEEEAQIARLRYLFEQGCKENLVMSPRDWPGASCVNTLITGHRDIQGDWYDRTGLYRANQRGKGAKLDDFKELLDLQLVSLPCWSHLSREEYAAECLDLVETIEKETRERHEEESTRVLGVTAIVNTHPHTRPEKVKKSPAPLVHAHDPEVRQEMIDRCREFSVAYWACSKALREGDTDVQFPEGSFPPPLPYVSRARAPD